MKDATHIKPDAREEGNKDNQQEAVRHVPVRRGDKHREIGNKLETFYTERNSNKTFSAKDYSRARNVPFGMSGLQEEEWEFQQEILWGISEEGLDNFYLSVLLLDPDNLPYRPVRCIDCFGYYIRSQGNQQETCLLCQRAGLSHIYENRTTPRCPKYRIIGENEDMIVIDYLEEFDGIYFSFPR